MDKNFEEMKLEEYKKLLGKPEKSIERERIIKEINLERIISNNGVQGCFFSPKFILEHWEDFDGLYHYIKYPEEILWGIIRGELLLHDTVHKSIPILIETQVLSGEMLKEVIRRYYCVPGLLHWFTIESKQPGFIEIIDWVIEEFGDYKVNWDTVSKYLPMGVEFIKNHIDKVPFILLTQNQYLTSQGVSISDLFELYKDFPIGWWIESIPENFVIDESELSERLVKLLTPYKILSTQRLSPEFIIENKNLLLSRCDALSKLQPLEEDFVLGPGKGLVYKIVWEKENRYRNLTRDGRCWITGYEIICINPIGNYIRQLQTFKPIMGLRDCNLCVNANKNRDLVIRKVGIKKNLVYPGIKYRNIEDCIIIWTKNLERYEKRINY